MTLQLHGVCSQAASALHEHPLLPPSQLGGRLRVQEFINVLMRRMVTLGMVVPQGQQPPITYFSPRTPSALSSVGDALGAAAANAQQYFGLKPAIIFVLMNKRSACPCQAAWLRGWTSCMGDGAGGPVVLAEGERVPDVANRHASPRTACNQPGRCIYLPRCCYPVHGFPCQHGYSNVCSLLSSPLLTSAVLRACTHAGPLYNEVKQASDSYLGIASQCIAAEGSRILTQTPNDQYCANLAMKVNAKLGGINAAPLQSTLPQWQNGPFMVLGALFNIVMLLDCGF